MDDNQECRVGVALYFQFLKLCILLSYKFGGFFCEITVLPFFCFFVPPPVLLLFLPFLFRDCALLPTAKFGCLKFEFLCLNNDKCGVDTAIVVFYFLSSVFFVFLFVILFYLYDFFFCNIVYTILNFFSFLFYI